MSNVIDICYAKLQSELLTLHLQLAGDLETTHKTESGKEVKVTRSPDGKFASKSGGSDSSSSAPKEAEGKVPPGNSAKLAKDILSGETGNQVKDSLVATATDPDVKIGIRKASFGDILGGAGDAMSNATDFIGKKMKEAKTAASKQPLGVIMGEILVGSFALAAVAGAAALAAGASAPVTAGIVVATNLLGLRIGSSVPSEKFKRENAEKFKKFQTPMSYAEMDKSVQELKKDKEAHRKLHKSVEEATLEYLDAQKSRQAR